MSSDDLDQSAFPKKPTTSASAAKPPKARSASAGAKRGRASSEPGDAGRGLRGKTGVSPWPNDGRAVHRRVEVPADASNEDFVNAVAQQFQFDREHVGVVKEVVHAMYTSQQQQNMVDPTSLTKRLDVMEQMHLRNNQRLTKEARDVSEQIKEVAIGGPGEIDNRIAVAMRTLELKDDEAR